VVKVVLLQAFQYLAVSATPQSVRDALISIQDQDQLALENQVTLAWVRHQGKFETEAGGY
jgi:hypothetical protein